MLLTFTRKENLKEEIMNDRRNFFRNALAVASTVFSAPALALQRRSAPVGSSVPPTPVLSPNLPDLPFTVDNGVKVFHLIAEPVKQQLAPNKTVDLWGFNGSAPGPTIQVTQGDRVRLIVDNRLPEPFSMHWHGFEIPHNMDG
ncbi:MAG: multicopper oxidase domain-containing protein, partial [Acidobacteriaceae bacterium]|nr:multicopper oxidase domain-containing protein [Acidobacteriaceae bacterium]